MARSLPHPTSPRDAGGSPELHGHGEVDSGVGQEDSVAESMLMQTSEVTYKDANTSGHGVTLAGSSLPTSIIEIQLPNSRRTE